MKNKKPVKKPQPSSPAAAPVARVMWQRPFNRSVISEQKTYGDDKPVLVIDLSRREEVVEVMARAYNKAAFGKDYETDWLEILNGRAEAILKALEQLARRGKK